MNINFKLVKIKGEMPVVLSSSAKLSDVSRSSKITLTDDESFKIESVYVITGINQSETPNGFRPNSSLTDNHIAISYMITLDTELIQEVGEDLIEQLFGYIQNNPPSSETMEREEGEMAQLLCRIRLNNVSKNLSHIKYYPKTLNSFGQRLALPETVEQSHALFRSIWVTAAGQLEKAHPDRVTEEKRIRGGIQL